MGSSWAVLGRGEKIQTRSLYVPNAAAYQADLAVRFFVPGNQFAQQR